MSPRALVTDAVGIGGVAAVLYGVGLVHPPSVWIVGGALAIVAAFIASGPPRSPP